MTVETIGRYQIKQILGQGGMATVYLALDPRFKREVAIKMLPEAMLHEPTFRTRFEREAEAIAALEHPAIVPVYDFGEENGQPYLVMRYMPGGSLADRLSRGPIALGEASQIITRLASALDAVHSHGLVHRDLKPGNILFDQYGNAFLSDFGIARFTQATTTLTGDAIIGTPAYMSPEQARGEPDIDGRSDIYALGAILFQMLTGKQPYEATTPMGVALKHLTEPVPSILEAKADLPPDSEQVIRQAMAKQRTERFATASGLASALEQITQHSEYQAAPAPISGAKPVFREIPAQKAPPARPAIPPDQVHPITPPPRTPLPAPARTSSASLLAKLKSWPWTAGCCAGILIIAVVCGFVGYRGIIKGRGFLSRFNPAVAVTATLSPSPAVQLVVNSPVPPTEASKPDNSPAPANFLDDFSDPGSGWPSQSTNEATLDYDGGSYRILVDVPNMIFWSTPDLIYEDIEISVEATKVGGPDENYFGVICRFLDDNNFYLFSITSDGYYSIGKYSGGKYAFIGMDAMQYSNAIHLGNTTNKLRVNCKGTSLSVYANGLLMGQAEDKEFTSGDVGLFAASFDQPGTNILFDNFAAKLP